MEDVDTKVLTSNPGPQVTFIRQKYAELRKKLDEKRRIQLLDEQLQSIQSNANRRVLRPRKPKEGPPRLSSLNPLTVPVPLLNFPDD